MQTFYHPYSIFLYFPQKVLFSGLRELIKIDNLKRTYRAGDYTLEFETVADLGLFLEVEYCTPDDVDVAQIKSQIQTFIDNLGFAVSPELNAGKPELMLHKKQQENKC